ARILRQASCASLMDGAAPALHPRPEAEPLQPAGANSRSLRDAARRWRDDRIADGEDAGQLPRLTFLARAAGAPCSAASPCTGRIDKVLQHLVGLGPYQALPIDNESGYAGDTQGARAGPVRIDSVTHRSARENLVGFLGRNSHFRGRFHQNVLFGKVLAMD